MDCFTSRRLVLKIGRMESNYSLLHAKASAETNNSNNSGSISRVIDLTRADGDAGMIVDLSLEEDSSDEA